MAWVARNWPPNWSLSHAHIHDQQRAPDSAAASRMRTIELRNMVSVKA